MQRKATITLTLVPALLLGGCAAADTRYPSLEIRDAERVGGTLEAPVQNLEPSPLNREAATEIPQIRANASSAHSAFMAAVPAARRAVASGATAAVATKAWGDAQIALADLESLRSATAIALADLDLILVNAKVGFEELEDVTAARKAVLPLVLEEDRILGELRGL